MRILENETLTSTKASPQPVSFRYDAVSRFSGVMATLILLVFAFALLAGLDGNTRTSPYAKQWISFVIYVVIVFFSAILVGGFLRTSALEVDECGVRCLVSGVCWRRLEWGDVKQIRVMQATALASIGEKPITQYFLDQTTGFHFPYAPGGPIFFTSQIQDHHSLLKVLNDYVGRFSIPIIDERPGGGGARLQRVE